MCVCIDIDVRYRRVCVCTVDKRGQSQGKVTQAVAAYRVASQRGAETANYSFTFH